VKRLESLKLDSKDDYSAACLPVYEPQNVDVLNEDSGVGYFVIDRSVLGRCWGGLRIATDLTLTEVKILARTMTVKSILACVPIGGAKGGVRLQTELVTRDQRLDLASRLVGHYLRRRSYFLGTDIGFGEKDANRVYQLTGSKRRVFSGRLSPGACCAHSVLASIEYVKRMNPKLEAVTAALEGFGNMAMPTAKLLTSNGYKIVAVSNIYGTLEDPAGLDVEQLAEMAVDYKDGCLSRYSSQRPSATFQSDESINFKKCDIVIPGARIFSISDAAARILKSKLVCPIANSPVTYSGEKILADRGIISVPDVISNSGAIIGSFAQQLGANESQTKNIIVEMINSNLESVCSGQMADRIPKLIAQDIAAQRMKRLEESERIAALQLLAPWFREFGFHSVLRALREYLSLKLPSGLLR
jgi:glutamate dehydrogenase (NAD(P)+)